ncbi:MAG: nicotinate (nicotinamide) nucleotide adenylyltransferase [Firmicutes bacterium]|nr:nicotinate (nicotinamide) nucleotide adenylyltransferase [Bacillota bacterium]
MSKIGVLGGTFDPIHKGHVALGLAAMDEVGLDRLIVMPAHIQPFKQHRKIAQDVHRLAMARLAFEGREGVEVSDYEMTKGDISYSYDTMAYLTSIYSYDELYFVMGTDSFLKVDRWYKGESLLEEFSFIVSSRPGYPEKVLEAKIRFIEEDYGTEIIRLKTKMPEISSTEIRENALFGESISHLVPKAVEDYIYENGLYDED